MSGKQLSIKYERRTEAERAEFLQRCLDRTRKEYAELPELNPDPSATVSYWIRPDRKIPVVAIFDFNRWPLRSKMRQSTRRAVHLWTRRQFLWETEAIEELPRHAAIGWHTLDRMFSMEVETFGSMFFLPLVHVIRKNRRAIDKVLAESRAKQAARDKKLAKRREQREQPV